MKAVYYTNKGCVRNGNEDALYIEGCAVCGVNMTSPSFIELDADMEIFCVIDGLGGFLGGATAAKIAAQTFQNRTTVESDIEKWLESTLQKACRVMREEASCLPELSEMGATLAGAVIDKNKKSIFAFNSGDCRVYRLQNGHLHKLTHDHSVVQELFDYGDISEEDMRTHPKKNIVTAGLGADEPWPGYFCKEFPLSDGDMFFACSDGVWEALPIDEIEKSLSGGDFVAACRELQDKLFLAKCNDNVSFVLVLNDVVDLRKRHNTQSEATRAMST